MFLPSSIFITSSDSTFVIFSSCLFYNFSWSILKFFSSSTLFSMSPSSFSTLNFSESCYFESSILWSLSSSTFSFHWFSDIFICSSFVRLKSEMCVVIKSTSFFNYIISFSWEMFFCVWSLSSFLIKVTVYFNSTIFYLTVFKVIFSMFLNSKDWNVIFSLRI